MKLAKKIFGSIVSGLIVMSSGISSYAIEIPSINWNIRSEENYNRFSEVMVNNFRVLIRNFVPSCRSKTTSQLYHSIDKKMFRLGERVVLDLNLACGDLVSRNYNDLETNLHQILVSMVNTVDCYMEIDSRLSNEGFVKNDLFLREIKEVNEQKQIYSNYLDDIIDINNYIKSNKENLRKFMIMND